MKNVTVLIIVAILTLQTRISAQVTEGYIPNNLGRIVEVANSGGTLPAPHLLIGYDTTGMMYNSNSTGNFKLFNYTPYATNLQSLNIHNRFGAPGRNDCYEIRFGSDSSRYWINTSFNGTGGNLAHNQLPFSVYYTGPKSSSDTSITGGTKLCIKISDQDDDSLYTAGEQIFVFADLALPLDSVYDSLSLRGENPFVFSNSVITRLRFGLTAIPYTQTSFAVPGDGVMPPHGTVIRFVAFTADSVAPVIMFGNTIQADNAGIIYRYPIKTYSCEPIVFELENAPQNMSLTNDTLLWSITTGQYGQSYPFRIKATNSKGHSYKTVVAYAGHSLINNYANLRDNNIDYWTSNNGSIVYNQLNTDYGMRWKNDNASIIFAGGMYLGGLKQGISGNPDTIAVTNIEYVSETMPGRIINNGPFGSLVAENPDTSAAKIFILPDHHTAWPAEAPHDGLGNPLKLSARDTWAVFNDIDITKAYPDGQNLATFSPGLGIECQRQTFQFIDYPFNNSVMVRLRLINKSNAVYNQFYFGLWSDIDVGYDIDDLAMVDSILPCFISYSNPSGSDGSNSATGLLMIQNPVTSGESSDTANVVTIGQNGFEHKRISGKKNVTASGAIAYASPAGEPNRLEGDYTRYRYLSGLNDLGLPKPNGRFDLTAAASNPGDHIGIIGVGPFSFFAGDTQEVWYSYLGGIGTNKANAVDTVLHYANFIKNRFYTDMNSVIVGINEPFTTIPRSVTLYPNYPNPFNPTTIIKYELKQTSKVSLKIYNLLGQEVRTLVNKQQSNGIHSVLWDGTNNHGQRVTSGVYFYRLQAGDFVKTRKMVLVK